MSVTSERRSSGSQPIPAAGGDPLSMRDRFDHVASKVTTAVGSPLAVVVAFLVVIAWLITGPLFNFSDTWQLLINTSTTIVTFWMVFLIQASSNRDNRALHLKLDEVIRAIDEARNEFIATEEAPAAEVEHREVELRALANGEDGALQSPQPEGHDRAGRNGAGSRPRRSAPRASGRSADGTSTKGGE